MLRSSFTVPGLPVGKPRQTQRDKWAKRPAVEAYRAWADECRLAATGNPLAKIQAETVIGIYAFFHLPVPDSLSEKQKQELYGRLHKQKPDADNLTKGLVDALISDDKAVAVMQGAKFYCEEGEAPHTDVFLLIP